MATQIDLDVLKTKISREIGELIDREIGRGIAEAAIKAKLSAEVLELAAHMHTGSDASFIEMARRSLALVRTGTIEQ
jgi:hypothetical protein